MNLHYTYYPATCLFFFFPQRQYHGHLFNCCKHCCLPHTIHLCVLEHISFPHGTADLWAKMLTYLNWQEKVEIIIKQVQNHFTPSGIVVIKKKEKKKDRKQQVLVRRYQKWKPPYTAGENAKRGSHFARQSGSSSKG